MNIQRGAARMTLKKEYILGTTISRLFLPVYFLGCPNNLLGAEPTSASSTSVPDPPFPLSDAT